MKKKIMAIAFTFIAILAMWVFMGTNKSYADSENNQSGQNNISIVVNSINTDADLYPVTSEKIRESDLYDQPIILINTATGQQENIYLKPNTSINLIEEYPEMFQLGSIYVIHVNGNPNWATVESIDFSGNSTFYSNEEMISFQLAEDTNINVDIKSKIVTGNIKFDMQYEEDDLEGITHAPDHYDIRLVIDEGSFKNYVSYYRLIEENDGNLKYVWIDTIEIPNGESMPETPEGLVNVVRINNNKKTEILAPRGLGVVWQLEGNSAFMPGANMFYYSSASDTQVSWNLKYENEYDVKTFNKTDVEGNPVDASFEVSYDDSNHKERVSNDPTTERRKFVYKHYDSKVIKGETYENVYEIIGSTTMDDETSDSIINTVNGKYTLYYPLYYATLNDYYRATHEIDKFVLGAGINLEKIYISEKTSGKNYIVNQDNLEIEIAESEDNYTFVNKKKPTVQEILDEGGDYDGEFEFEVYDVETGELVGKVRAPSRKIVALEPKVTDSEGNTTGYLEDGKKYRVIKKEIEDIENYDVKTTKGETGEEDSKYVEFTFNGDLDDICDIVFYDKQIKKEEPEKELEEEPTTEPEKEEPAEETKTEEQKEETTEEEKTPEEKAEQVQTGDVITTIFATLGIAIIGLMVTLKIKKNK